jgi:hypothetical protein
MANTIQTIDFGTTATDEATLLVTGESGLTVNSYMEAWWQDSDSTVDNPASSHKFMGMYSSIRCEYVSATTLNINVRKNLGRATKTFKVRLMTVP